MASQPEDPTIDVAMDTDSGPKSESTTLRKRRSNEQTKREGKRVSVKSRNITQQEANVYLNMEMRKSERRRSGKTKKGGVSWVDILSIVAFLAVIVGLGTQNITDDVISFTIGQLIAFTVWFSALA